MEQPAFRFSLFAAAIAAMAASHPLKAAPGDKVGPEFLVNTTVSGHQAQPDIALSANGDYVVSWADYSASSGGIYFRRYNANGTPKDPRAVLAVPDGYLPPCERSQPDDFCYENRDGIPPHDAEVAVDRDGDFVVKWEQYFDTYSYNDSRFVYVRRFSASGAPLDEAPVSAGVACCSSSVAMDDDGDFVVVTDATDGTLDDHGGDCYPMSIAHFAKDGTRLEGGSFGDEYCSENPQVAMDAGGDYVVAFNTNSFAYDFCYRSSSGCQRYIGVRRFNSLGLPLDASDIKVSDFGQVNDIAIDDHGDFTVVWSDVYYLHSQYSTSGNVFARRYFANGTPKGPATQVNAVGSGIHGDAKLGIASDGSFTVAWERLSTVRDNSEIFWRGFDRNSVPIKDVHLRANTFTAGYQSRPAIAVNADGAFTVAWQSEGQDGSGTGIFAQRFEGNAPPPPALPTVSFARAAQAVDESAGLVNVRITLSAVSASPVTVPLRLGGTATRNSDYRLPGNSVVIPAGARFANVPVTIINDRKREPRESLTLTMGKPANATKGAITGFELAIKKSD